MHIHHWMSYITSTSIYVILTPLKTRGFPCEDSSTNPSSLSHRPFPSSRCLYSHRATLNTYEMFGKLQTPADHSSVKHLIELSPGPWTNLLIKDRGGITLAWWTQTHKHTHIHTHTHTHSDKHRSNESQLWMVAWYSKTSINVEWRQDMLTY